MKPQYSIIGLLFLSISSIAVAQQDLVAAVVGNVTGTVEDKDGNLVPPQTAVQATVNATDNNGTIVANVSGTASCTGGLGLHFAFEAQYDSTSNSFSGMYSHTPGEAPSIPLNFTPTGGTAWTTTLSGQASSPTGLRAYDLAFDFEIPQTAIFSGNALPSDRTYRGNLASTQTVVVPLSIPAFGVNETLNFEIDFTGTWDAVSVPKTDGTSVFTGSTSGTFQSQNSQTITITPPPVGSITVPPITQTISVFGSWGGSLFLIDEDTVSFQGAWTGSALNQSYGGDINIDIEFADISSFPFSVSGAIPISPGIEGAPAVIEIPFQVSGNFPLSVQ